MKINTKSILHEKINAKILDKIINLKMEEWIYSKTQHLNWIKKNLKKKDLHIILEVNNKICGYTCLRNKYFYHNKKRVYFYYFDTLILKKKLRNLKLSSVLMEYNMKKINHEYKLAVLVCKKNLVNFYKKFNWKINVLFKINKKKEYYKMSYNSKINLFKNKYIKV